MITHPYILQIEITFNKQYNIDISKRIIATIIKKRPRQHKIRSFMFFFQREIHYIHFILLIQYTFTGVAQTISLRGIFVVNGEKTNSAYM